MFFLYVLALSCFIQTQAPVSAEENLSHIDDDFYYPIAESTNDVDWQLLKAFSDPSIKNVIISPISLKLVLALLYQGANGTTAEQLKKVLNLPDNKTAVAEKFSKKLQVLQKNANHEFLLTLENIIFLDSKLNPKKNFVETVQKCYQTKLQNTDFKKPDEASKTINEWVKNVTNGKIQALVTSDDLEQAIMIIANAVFFKGTWRTEFPKKNTKPGGFYVNPENIVQVSYMSTTNKFYYYESVELQAKILRMPYKGNQFALFILLPTTKEGLPSLLEKFGPNSIKEFYQLDNVPVEVIIPKFKFNFKSQFTEILRSMGISSIFENTASFPDIVEEGENLFVSNILQKSGIEIDEEGSIAYAASDIEISNKFGEVDNLFNASHPFLFFIEDQVEGTILFAGKVENPLTEDVEVNPVTSPIQSSDNILTMPVGTKGMKAQVRMSKKGFSLYVKPPPNNKQI